MKLTRNLGIALIALTLSSAAYGQAYLSNPRKAAKSVLPISLFIANTISRKTM